VFNARRDALMRSPVQHGILNPKFSGIKMFHIKFVNHALSSTLARGEIRAGQFHEQFEASIEFWNKIQYQIHWHTQILKILDKNDKSCLITSITNPSTANFIFWWPIYKIGDLCFIQNQILFLDKLFEPFDPANPCRYVPDRQTITEDGDPISEWVISLNDLRLWTSQLKKNQ